MSVTTIKLLFICSRNRWRSPTAERLFDGVQGYQARSAGTEPVARARVNEKLILWADIIFCMERRHAQRLRERFPEALQNKEVHVLDVPDEYRYMDPDLIDTLGASLSEYGVVPPEIS